MSRLITSICIVLTLLIIQGCSGNGFKLRENIKLSSQFTATYLKGVTAESNFSTIFSDALLEAGGKLVESESKAQAIVQLSKFEEGRRVIAYTSDRRAREYLVFLKIEYAIRTDNKSLKNIRHRINIDRSYLYDQDFALGKAEEEKRVKQALYEEATRLILLKLKYEKSN